MTKKPLLLPLVIFVALFGFYQAVQAQNGTLYFSPATGVFEESASFWLNIMVDTTGQAVNAVAAYFSYPEDKLEPLGVNTVGSVMTIWPEKEAVGGRVKIAGGLPTPGFSGIKKVASLGFKAKTSSGSVNFKFSEDSAVLTDLDNSNILNLNLSGEGNYSFEPKTVVPPEIKPAVISELKVSQITQREATISWKTDKEADSQIEYGLSADYGLMVSDGKLSKEHSITISGLSAGTLYHIRVRSGLATGQESKSEDLTFSTLGYQAEIKVLNIASNEPIVGAEVISPPPNQSVKITDEEGKVIFDNLGLGEQWIAVKYKDKTASSPIEITAWGEPQKFEVKFRLPEARKSLFLAFALTIIIVAALVIFLWFLKRRYC